MLLVLLKYSYFVFGDASDTCATCTDPAPLIAKYHFPACCWSAACTIKNTHSALTLSVQKLTFRFRLWVVCVQIIVHLVETNAGKGGGGQCRAVAHLHGTQFSPKNKVCLRFKIATCSNFTMQCIVNWMKAFSFVYSQTPKVARVKIQLEDAFVDCTIFALSSNAPQCLHHLDLDRLCVINSAYGDILTFRLRRWNID